MSEAEPQDQVNTELTEGTVSHSIDASSLAEPETHGEHEAETVGMEAPAEETVSAAGKNGDSNTNGAGKLQSDDTPIVDDAASSPADEDKKEPSDTAGSAKPKPEMSIKTSVSKSAGPSTPLVKKILNSGTFGAGSVKNVPAVKAATGAVHSVANKAATATSALKKSISAPSSSPTKPTAVVKTPSTGTPASGPARRASVIPSKPSAPPPSKPSLSSSANKSLSSSTSKTPLSSSTSSKPATSATAKPTVAQRSVVSPAGSTASVQSTGTRPRASVSEGVKKAPLAARQSISGATATKPGLTKPAGTKPTRTTGSISSIREVREDGKALEDLQTKLREATASLSAKSNTVTELEGQISALKTSLEAAQSDVEAKEAAVEQLEQAKTASAAELAEVKASLEKLQADDTSSALAAVQEQLEAAKAAATTQTELVQTLQAQIQTLETEVKAAKENFDNLQASHDAASSNAASAAQIDRDALVKAKADYDTITTETEALKVTHATALDEATTKLKEYEIKAANAEALEKELADLKVEKEEAASKISELEVEILETKECQDKAQDAEEKALAKVKALEQELANAVAATQQAVDNATVKDTEHLQHIADIKNAHDEELKALADEQAKVVAQLEALQKELAASQAAHEQAKADIQAATKDHAHNLSEAEQVHLGKQNELAEEIKKVTAELEGQEAQYNSKVEAVKAEHDKLLEEAFERAKNEAGAAHGQDLQGLRADSQATIEQLRTAHQSTIEDMQKEHAALLDSQVKALEKQIGSQAVDLKATQDDLVKAKAALEASRTDVASLTAQFEEAKAAAEAPAAPDPAIAEEIERLTKELSHAKDDVAAAQDVLSLTKQSQAEATDNQTKELEEAAKGRAEEVTRLKVEHEEEIGILVAQKTELATKLSDFEGELATLKASIAAESPASPKVNGTNGAVHASNVTVEELQQMHEAHNAKVHDLQAEHDKALKAVKESLEVSLSKADELQQEVARKAMEIQYLEQEQDESQDQITRLKADMESLTEQLKAKETAAVA